jgi:hypothetical protein
VLSSPLAGELVWNISKATAYTFNGCLTTSFSPHELLVESKRGDRILRFPIGSWDIQSFAGNADHRSEIRRLAGGCFEPAEAKKIKCHTPGPFTSLIQGKISPFRLERKEPVEQSCLRFRILSLELFCTATSLLYCRF